MLRFEPRQGTGTFHGQYSQDTVQQVVRCTLELPRSGARFFFFFLINCYVVYLLGHHIQDQKFLTYFTTLHACSL